MLNHFPGVYVHLAKMVCLLAGIVLAFCLRSARRNSLKMLEKKLNIGLGITAILSILAFYNFTALHNGRVFHVHEFFHYYMGSKYFDEVGYLYLYDAALLADEQGQHFFKNVKTIKNQENYQSMPRDVIHDKVRLNNWRPNFTAERWKAFKQDLNWFENRHKEVYPNPDERGRLVNDFGYNASPIWMLLGRPLTNAISTSNYPGMLLLAWLDGILALGMFCVLYWAFDFEVMAFTAIFWGATFMYVYEYTGGALLRHDWIVFAVIAVCLLKKEMPWPAGFFFAYSIGLRMFPALFALPGIAVLGIRLFRKQQHPLSPADQLGLKFFLATGLSLALLVAFTALFGPGDWGGWPTFIAKMRLHAERGTVPWGLSDIYFWWGDMGINESSLPYHWQATRYAVYRQLWPLVDCVKLVMLALLVRVSFRLDYWEMLCLGSSVAFALLLLSKYYYVDLVILVPMLCVHWEQPWRVRALTLLFSSQIALHLLDRVFPNINYMFIAFFFAIFLAIFYLYCFFAPIQEGEKRPRLQAS